MVSWFRVAALLVATSTVSCAAVEIIDVENESLAVSTAISNPKTVENLAAPAASVSVESPVATTTYILFSAKSTSSYEYPTTTASPTTTQKNPLVTVGEIVETALSNAIDTKTLSKAVELIEEATGNITRVLLGSAEIEKRDENKIVKRATSNGFTGDLFKAISTKALSKKFKEKELPLSIPDGVTNSVKYQTNKFYVNFFLGDQTYMVWSYPYGMQWVNSDYYGFAIQHTITANRVFGKANGDNKYSYYYNTINVRELIFSATSFSAVKMRVKNMKVMSANVQLSKSGSTSNYIEFPVVQGMGLVTSIYHGSLIPRIDSAVGYTKLTAETSSNLKSNVLKYRVTLTTGVQWLLYVVLPDSSKSFSFTVGSNSLKGSQSIDGLIIQAAVAPSTTSQEQYYDRAVGKYPTEAKVKAHGYSGKTAEYRFSYNTKGSSKSGSPIVFALPHHVETFTSATTAYKTGITIPSTTKGNMTAYLTSELIMTETFTTDIQFLPWTKALGSSTLTYSSAQLKAIAKVANTELAVDIPTLVNSVNSNYYSGKVLDKYAYILLVVSEIIGDEDLAKSTLASMKEAFATFISNKQYYPLMYDTKFGGITSTASQDGDTGADFGSAYYNDHHFHYGYFIHAAAVVGLVDNKFGDGTWIKSNQFWINSLIRDANNPSPDDSHFPVFRMFDWYAGHSWASGLFAGGDGRNEESSSEDYNFAYGIKLWGKVSGNKRMENIGDLMLAVMSRAMNKYMYYSSSNTVEPSDFIANKVSGIFYDNKIDHTTYFGTNEEYIHGIHMLPITPASALIRGLTFVEEEWLSLISSIIDDVESGWTSVLRLNQALFDAESSYSFFSGLSWDDSYLDNGQSRTWAMAFSAGISNI